MADSPQDFEQPVNRRRLERLAADRGETSVPGAPLPGSADAAPAPTGGVTPLEPAGTDPSAAAPAEAEPAAAAPAEEEAAPAKPKPGVQRLGRDGKELSQDALSKTAASPRHQIEAWLAGMVTANASDLILRAGGRPSQRANGKINFLPGRVPGPGPLLEVLGAVMGENRMKTWRTTGSADAALHLDGLGRFRLNAYKQMGEPAVVIRRINEQAPNIEELGLPMEQLQKLALRKRGLMLVTGIAGSGKSTTLAGMIQHMNEHVERHVITLEDPVELIYTEECCVISQREVGTDCEDFGDGLRHALRQSPDVILIGEMRDAETVIAALDATETGHLVMSTLHTVNAPQTVDRILSFFPSEQHAQVRSRLADNIAGVMSQRLIPRADGEGMLPAFELLVSTPHVRELLQEGNTGELARVIEQGTEEGLISFNQCLRQLVLDHQVDLQEALAASDKPDDLVLALRGITASHGRPTRGGNPAAPAPSGPRPTSPHDDGSPGLRMAD